VLGGYAWGTESDLATSAIDVGGGNVRKTSSICTVGSGCGERIRGKTRVSVAGRRGMYCWGLAATISEALCANMLWSCHNCVLADDLDLKILQPDSHCCSNLTTDRPSRCCFWMSAGGFAADDDGCDGDLTASGGQMLATGIG